MIHVQMKHTSKIFWQRKCWCGDDRTGWLKYQHLKYQQTPGHNLIPPAVVLASTNPAVPVLDGVHL